MKLLSLEIRRGLARRGTRVLLLVAFMGICVIAGTIFATSSRTVDPQAPAHLDRAVRACVESEGFRGEMQVPDGESIEKACRSAFANSPSFSDQRFHLVDLWGDGDGDNLLGVTLVALVLGAFIGGATFIGGDWRWNTVATQLTWEPRRLRLFLAKATAVVVLSIVIGVALQLLVCLAVLPAVHFRGTTQGADAEWFAGLIGAIGRFSLLGAGAALLGHSLAWIGRSTSTALGAAFGYLVVLEALVRNLRPQWQRWLVGDNAAVVVTKGTARLAFDRSPLAAAGVLALYLAGVTIVAAVTFRQRDIS